MRQGDNEEELEKPLLVSETSNFQAARQAFLGILRRRGINYRFTLLYGHKMRDAFFSSLLLSQFVR